MESDVSLIAEQPSTMDAVTGFAFAWSLVSSTPAEALREVYIDQNPHPEDSRHLLDRGEAGSIYDTRHAQVHPAFRKVVLKKNYYDAFLISPAGDIVYSVFKNADFGTNLLNGPYKDSSLGDLFRAVVASESNEVQFADFEAYAPKGGAFSGFMAAPIRNDAGEILGVIAFEKPASVLNQIALDPVGLGETGEAIIIASDKTTRNASRQSDSYQAMGPIPEGHWAGNAGGENASSFSDVIGVSGTPALAHISPIESDWVDWQLAVEQDQTEVLGPLRELKTTLLVTSLTLSLIHISEPTRPY